MSRGALDIVGSGDHLGPMLGVVGYRVIRYKYNRFIRQESGSRKEG